MEGWVEGGLLAFVARGGLAWAEAGVAVARRCAALLRLLGHGRRKAAAGAIFGSAHVSPLPRQHAWHGTGIWTRQGNRRGQKC